MNEEVNSAVAAEDIEQTYDQLAAKMEAAKEQELIKLYSKRQSAQATVDKLDRDILKVAGSPEERDRRILLIAVKNTGPKGIVLEDLRAVIRDPNDLNNARKALREPKDSEGNALIPLIREQREKLEIRVFLAEANESKA